MGRGSMRWAISACMVCGLATQAHAAGLRLTMWAAPPINTGTEYGFGAAFEKEDRFDGIVHHAPFRLRVVVPEGMSLIAPNVSNNWTCPPPSEGAREMTCTYLADLHGSIPSSMSLRAGPVRLNS